MFNLCSNVLAGGDGHCRFFISRANTVESFIMAAPSRKNANNKGFTKSNKENVGEVEVYIQ